MQSVRILFILLFLTACASQPPVPSVVYDWAAHADFAALRKEIGWSEDYNKRCFAGRPLAGMVEAMNKEQWADAAVIGERWLQQCPIDIRAHYYMGICRERQQEAAVSNAHFRWVNGLMDDLVSSGDGKTAETAYEVVSVAEEYDAVYVFGLTVKSQALVSSDSPRDLITAIDEDGKEVSIYFNPAAHFARLAKMLK
jgi:hypothetical protein